MSPAPADLLWWLRLAEKLEWTWARTYAETAPHWYVVLGRTEGLARADFVRAAKVIHTFGEPGRFYRSTNIYLSNGQWRWWTMDERLEDTDLINRAVNDRVYGVQDAPRTFNAAVTEFDAIGTEYDGRPRDAAADEAVRLQITEHFAGDSPTVLDVGCGTGALLDLGVVDPRRYTGVDPSQAMLNALVRKHPSVSRLIPARFEDVPDDFLAPRYGLVVAMDVPGIDTERLRRLGGLLIVTPPEFPDPTSADRPG